MDLCYAGNESISRLISNSGNERVLALTRETETYHHSLHKIAKTSNLFLVWRTKLRRGGEKSPSASKSNDFYSFCSFDGPRNV